MESKNTKGVEDRFIKFLEEEKGPLGMSDHKTIDRILWYYKTYFASENSELSELKEWKRQAIEAMPDFQEIGKLLNIPLGQSVTKNIIPKIKELQHTPSPPSERVEDAAALRWVKASERTPEDKKTVFFIVKSTGIRHIGYYHEKTTMFIDEKNRRHYPTHIEWAQEYRQSQPVQAGQWVKDKPQLTEECILITHTVFRNNHEYQAWQILRIESEEGWYFGLCTMDGEEWGDYEDLKSDHYKIVSDFIV